MGNSKSGSAGRGAARTSTRADAGPAPGSTGSFGGGGRTASTSAASRRGNTRAGATMRRPGQQQNDQQPHQHSSPVRCPRCRRLLQPPAGHDRFLCPCGQMLMAPPAPGASSGAVSAQQQPQQRQQPQPQQQQQQQVQHVRCPNCNTTLAPPPGAPVFRCPCGTHLRAPNITRTQVSQRALVDPNAGMLDRSMDEVPEDSAFQMANHPEMVASYVQRRSEQQWMREVADDGRTLVWKNLQSDEEERRKLLLEEKCLQELPDKVPELTTKDLYEKLESMRVSTDKCDSDEDLREALLNARDILIEESMEELSDRLDALGVSYDGLISPEELADRLITAVWYDGLYDDGYVREVLPDFSLDWIPASKFRMQPDMPPKPISARTLEHMSTQPFQNKITWFREQMKDMKTPWEDGHVQVKVRRRDLLRDAFTNLNKLEAEHMRRHFRFEFLGEPGLDAGGVAREFFELVTDSIFNVDFGLFEYSGVDNICYSINPSSGIANELHMRYFYFLGRIMGKALFDGHIIPAHLTRPMYKHLLGFPITEADIEFVDPVVYKSMIDIKECEDVEYLYLDFTTATRVFGETQSVELKPGGADIEVTNENREQYLHLLVKFILFDRIAPQLAMLLRGFYEVVPAHLISVFDYQELELLMCGLPNIDVDDWRKNTSYRGAYQGKGDSHQVVGWFWEVIAEFSQEQRAKFLQFATGTSRVPVQGFSALQSSEGVLKLFTIDSIAYDRSVFPRSHTCFNRIDLPVYPDKQTLKRYILKALSMEAVGFAEE